MEPALDCGTYHVGNLLRGPYSITDEHFGSLGALFGAGRASQRRSRDPFAPHGVPGGTNRGHVGHLDPRHHRHGPCGYTIQLLSGDRTIVSCVTNWENNTAFIGFSLV
jgi:hypothetical protein